MNPLTAAIRGVLDKSKEADPAVIAKRAVMKLTDDECREALMLAARTEARIEMSRARMAANAAPVTASKWDRHRSDLRLRVSVDGHFKLMADCTAEDFDWLAADRERQATALAQQAENFRRLAAEMRAVGAQTFAALLDQKAVAA